jgi:hypothetical protein
LAVGGLRALRPERNTAGLGLRVEELRAHARPGVSRNPPLPGSSQGIKRALFGCLRPLILIMESIVTVSSAATC